MNKLLEVVSDLRDPINGCPWDLKQTHLSLVPYVLEEAYEVAHAIREDNPDELKEELGDLLLQVILHAQIAKEKNLFDITDIIDIITEKLIRRHPHVFQNKAKVSIKEVEDSWEKIKNNEKPLNNSKTPISDRLKLKIRPQPSTKAALIISKKASKNGFEWENIDQIWDKLYEEFDKIQYEAEMRKAFPPLEEQMAKLDPALQVELIEMEHLYQQQLKTAREVRQNILDTTDDYYKANIMCGEMSRNAVNTRTNKVKELRLLWGNFFYHHIV